MMRVVVFIFIASLTPTIFAERFIVELTEAPSQQTRVRQQHEHARSQLSDINVRIVGATDRVANTIIVEAANAEALAGLAHVKRIYATYRMRVSMNRAVELMQVPVAWQAIGGMDKAGLGIKIGILDTGIDATHPAFQDSELSLPDGFPKYSSDLNRRHTSNKVIVARSYDDRSALDVYGHGTGVATVAAGVPRQTSNGVISGIAPKAWLGNYRVNDSASGYISSDAVLLAIDDAVKDGMDVLNLSFGGPNFTPASQDILSTAVEHATAAGLIVVTAAGNEGPDPATISNLSAAPGIIAVGSSDNDRTLAEPGVRAAGSSITWPALPASNSQNAPSLTAPMMDVGKACQGVSSAAGRIALIERGDCDFQTKLTNAQSAGAAAAIVYDNTSNPSLTSMLAGAATINSLFVSASHGAELKTRMLIDPAMQVTLTFGGFQAIDPDHLSDFSSHGPTTDLQIKPDIVAIGGHVITATPTSSTGALWTLTSGTSFASPAVAGAAAVLKSARPGQTSATYRSLLINAAGAYPNGRISAIVQESGAGFINLPASIQSTVAVEPTSLNLGLLNGTSVSKELVFRNLQQAPQSCEVDTTTTDSVRPQVAPFELAAEGVARVPVSLAVTNPQPGVFQGLFTVRCSAGTVVRVPYWLGIRSTQPKNISLINFYPQVPGGVYVDFLMRVVDAAGIALAEPAPQVTVVAGDGSVAALESLGLQYPGVYWIVVRVGYDPEVEFRVTAGQAERKFKIRTVR